MIEPESDSPDGAQPSSSLDRREFLKQCCLAGPIMLTTLRVAASAGEQAKGYNPAEHHYGMAIDVAKCIGCGRCADACKTENDVPREPLYFRTWVEHYVIQVDECR